MKELPQGATFWRTVLLLGVFGGWISLVSPTLLSAQQTAQTERIPAEVSGNLADGRVPALPLPPIDAEPGQVRIAVLNRSGQPLRLSSTMLSLDAQQLLAIEKRLGQRVEVVSIAAAAPARHPGDTIYYRRGFLRAALMLAQRLPGDQHIRHLPKNEPPPLGIDLNIVLGPPFP